MLPQRAVDHLALPQSHCRSRGRACTHEPMMNITTSARSEGTDVTPLARTNQHRRTSKLPITRHTTTSLSHRSHAIIMTRRTMPAQHHSTHSVFPFLLSHVHFAQTRVRVQMIVIDPCGLSSQYHVHTVIRRSMRVSDSNTNSSPDCTCAVRWSCS